ncbi:SRC kinase signaling inhibitor 1 [Saguinus oedipus]|uniref:SRC kinase signaling inhibitor 1 n=1 Tax=Saguinus oedipus TaxID=9490 RepID=A0ABQ9VR88_SAGOE|nr:SRC kinase signaling inhibitor 1 [Saguinus oedipus]
MLRHGGVNRRQSSDPNIANGCLANDFINRLSTPCPIIKPITQTVYLRELGTCSTFLAEFSILLKGGSCLFWGRKQIQQPQGEGLEESFPLRPEDHRELAIDLEKSVEKIQRDVSHNHRLVPGPELEEKALVLKQLGETLTELKVGSTPSGPGSRLPVSLAHFPGLQSKMRVVLRVEVEAVKFLKEEPQRLDGLLKRCRGVTDTLAQIRRQVDEGVWPSPNNLLSQSPKKVMAETDFNKSVDFEMPPPSPPLNLHELSGPAEGASLTPKGGNPTKGLDTPGKRSVDKAVSVEEASFSIPCLYGCGEEAEAPEVLEQESYLSPDSWPPLKAAERDWEEKRAALTQYSAKDINRLLEETQAELLKAIPDLDCASKAHPGPAPTPDHKPPKAPHGQKAAPRTEPSGRRGSGMGSSRDGGEPTVGECPPWELRLTGQHWSIKTIVVGLPDKGVPVSPLKGD